MRCSLEELRQKEVIHVQTGEKLGFIDDVELDADSSTVRGFLIYGRRCFGGFLRKEADLFIPCSGIRLYGKDVVLTDSAQIVGKNAQKEPDSTLKICR